MDSVSIIFGKVNWVRSVISCVSLDLHRSESWSEKKKKIRNSDSFSWNMKLLYDLIEVKLVGNHSPNSAGFLSEGNSLLELFQGWSKPLKALNDFSWSSKDYCES